MGGRKRGEGRKGVRGEGEEMREVRGRKKEGELAGGRANQGYATLARSSMFYKKSSRILITKHSILKSLFVLHQWLHGSDLSRFYPSAVGTHETDIDGRKYR